MTLSVAAFLILRLAFGGLFVFTGWTLYSGWAWTLDNTAILVGSKRAPLFSACAIAIMVIGGLSICVGFYGQMGAIAIVAFLIGGTRIHWLSKGQAGKLAADVTEAQRNAGVALVAAASTTLSKLTTSAFAAHLANVYKNLALIGIAIFFILAGTGAASVDCSLHLTEFFNGCERTLP